MYVVVTGSHAVLRRQGLDHGRRKSTALEVQQGQGRYRGNPHQEVELLHRLHSGSLFARLRLGLSRAPQGLLQARVDHRPQDRRQVEDHHAAPGPAQPLQDGHSRQARGEPAAVRRAAGVVGARPALRVADAAGGLDPFALYRGVLCLRQHRQGRHPQAGDHCPEQERGGKSSRAGQHGALLYAVLRRECAGARPERAVLLFRLRGGTGGGDRP
ncbi:hypothetical protein D3C81_1343920 [compost metagenome]